MPLFRDGRLVGDAWTFVADGAPLPAGPVAVGKTRFLAERATLIARDEPIGLILDPGETLDGIADDLPRFALVALRFARFADGRPYSIARRLRDVHGFTGELRATGDVLRDQITFMLRAGFDSLDVSDAGTADALRSGRLVVVRRHYQTASRRAAEATPPGAAWRRISDPPGSGEPTPA
ncbi:MAG: DUF934 domain-containing protein [Alphaproteobacteria bacterium]|nr:DUF934 domain-containing protein [Alphaproteobacteria bacterium]